MFQNIINTQYLHMTSSGFLRLSVKADLSLDSEWTDWLDEISTFNLNARYDNYKQDFYKKANREFAEIWVNRIETLRQWLIQQL